MWPSADVRIQATKMDSSIIKHLNERKIAPIFNNCNEKENPIAVALICVLDHCLEKNKLYENIRKTPKLLHQLLAFKSFGTFRYWKYGMPKILGTHHLLKCKICSLVGPYALILSHMATTHNTHHGAIKCMWCSKKTLKFHADTRTLDSCYERYISDNEINEDVPTVVSEFYDVIEVLAKKLGVLSKRNSNYGGDGIRRNSINLYDGICSVTTFKNYRNKQNMNVPQLNVFFEKAMVDFYGERQGFKMKLSLNIGGSATQEYFDRSSNATTSAPSSSNHSIPSQHIPNSDGVKPDQMRQYESPIEASDMEFANVIGNLLGAIPNDQINIKNKLKRDIHSLVLGGHLKVLQNHLANQSTDAEEHDVAKHPKI